MSTNLLRWLAETGNTGAVTAFAVVYLIVLSSSFVLGTLSRSAS